MWQSSETKECVKSSYFGSQRQRVSRLFENVYIHNGKHASVAKLLLANIASLPHVAV